MELEQLIENATEMWNDQDTHRYLTMVVVGYLGKLGLELSGYWKRREMEINDICGNITAKKYRNMITKMSVLPFPLDMAYSIRMLFG